MNPGMNGRQIPEVLIARAKAGDAAAVGSLLECYRNYLGLLARCQIGALLGSHLDPSDLAQETIIEAHRDFPAFAGANERQLLAWLRRILARNLADEIKRQQAQRRDWNRQESLETLLERSSVTVQKALAASLGSPSSEACQREQAVILADALSRLPPDYRDVIVMRNIDSLKFEEIAARMGRSAGAVRKLWTRALIQLRSELRTLP